jgi:hypothetical protein
VQGENIIASGCKIGTLVSFVLQSSHRLGFLVVPHFSSAMIFHYGLHKSTISDENTLPKPYRASSPQYLNRN